MQDENIEIQQPQTLPLGQQQQQQQQQQQSSNMSSATASSRHYVDKARLIKLVHENPILWDCRLPNYKRADKSKTDQWNSLGTIFNVSGERVQRTFTSLREIFRRELNNEKLLGRRFKSKWEFYKSMSFLRDVIRERKPRERHPAKVSRRSQLSPSINNPPSNSNGIDEYQYFAPNDPNNPSLQQQQQNQQQQEAITPATNEKLTATTFKPEMAQISLGNNNSQLSVLSLLTQLNNGTPQQQQHHQQNQQQQQQTNNNNDDDNDNDDVVNMVNMVQPSPASSTTPSMYIKDEIEIPDEDDDDEEAEGEGEEDTTSITFNGEILYSNNNKLNIVKSSVLNNIEGSVVSRCKRRTKINRNTKNWKRIAKNNKEECEILEDDDDDIDDIDEDELSSVESLPNTNNTINNGNKSKLLLGNGVVNNLNDEAKVNHHDLVHEQLSSVSCIGVSGGGGGIGTSGEAGEIKYRRHLVYTKFADFIVAKMDAMCERDADDLMDRMMLVIAQKH